ncbi:MAG: RagB/SusD family nutrient uptake outer membrane protein [Prolixibacteraceae bacterium]|nr:RagB/SusD family nutrient uptake outer membrane protein [Prolixibacteraceae bacterium]
MKKYLINILPLFLGLILITCSEDYLDIPQKSVLESQSYYENAGPDEAEALIAAIYDQYYTGMEGVSSQIFLDVLSDDHFAGGNSFADAAMQFQEASNLIINSTQGNLNTQFVNSYKLIYWANNIIEKIPESSDSRIQRVKAEAKFFRALCMFENVRWWGTPPFVDHVLTPDEYYPGNGDHAEIISWCLTQMQEAADDLPALSGMGQQRAYGARVSKHTALAYKGKIALWYGTRYDDATILAQAIQPLSTVITSGLYGLVEDMFIIDRPAADFCKEYLWEHNAADNNGYDSDQAGINPVWTNWRPENMTLPDELYNLGWGWDPPTGDFGDFLKEHEGGIDKPRFKSTLHTYEQALAMSYENAAGPPGVIAGVSACQGYFRYRKLLFKEDIFNIASWWKSSKANVHFMRYPEVLLMYAEAQFLVNGDSDGTGLQALNQVRERAELELLGSMTYQDIKDERRAELWQEGERYFDLVRWGDAAEALKDKGKTWYTFYGYQEDGVTWDIRTREGSGNGWNPKYELLPFPYSQLSANENLIQNPDW